MNNPLIKYIPVDKQMHLGAGLLISGIVSLVTVPLAGFAIGCLAGAAKEAYDYYQNRKSKAAGFPDTHDVDIQDFLWTGYGAAAAAFVVLLFRLWSH